MRSFLAVINHILALLPDPATVSDPQFAANITALKPELTALIRRALYVAPEDNTVWRDMTNLLNRYLPTPSATSGNFWAWQISLVMRNISPTPPIA